MKFSEVLSPAIAVTRRRLMALTLAIAVAAIGGCADDEPVTSGAAELVGEGATVVVANSPGALSTSGPQRVLVALIGDGPNQFLGSEDVDAVIEFRSPDGESTDLVDGMWISTPGTPLGMYVAHYTFPEPGPWEIAMAGAAAQTGFIIDVVDDATIPEPGDDAPRSVTPTARSLEEATAISTDPEPALRFYQLSVDEAVTSGRPSVIVFATPAFCQTAACGPTVELAKDVADGHPDINFVHVEPYDIDQARDGTLVPVDVLGEWNLLTEPWVFVVDGDGVVAASFEGLIAPEELDEAIDGL